LTYRRFHAGRWITVAFNFSTAPRLMVLRPEAKEVLILTYLDRAEKLKKRRRCAPRRPFCQREVRGPAGTPTGHVFGTYAP